MSNMTTYMAITGFSSYHNATCTMDLCYSEMIYNWSFPYSIKSTVADNPYCYIQLSCSLIVSQLDVMRHLQFIPLANSSLFLIPNILCGLIFTHLSIFFVFSQLLIVFTEENKTFL